MTELLVVPHGSGSKAPHRTTYPSQCVFMFSNYVCMMSIQNCPEDSLKFFASQRWLNQKNVSYVAIWIPDYREKSFWDPFLSPSILHLPDPVFLTGLSLRFGPGLSSTIWVGIIWVVTLPFSNTLGVSHSSPVETGVSPTGCFRFKIRRYCWD